MEGAAPVDATIPQSYTALEGAMGINKAPAAVAPKVAEPAKPEEKPAAAQQPAAEVKPEEKPAELNIDNLTDEEINTLIEKRTGKKVSLAEIATPEPKTKEEIEQETVRRKEEALSWAIDNQRLTRKQYEDAVVGKNTSDRDIKLAAFTQELQAEDKNITKEEAEELFKDAYHENDPESRLFKVGQNEIKKFADAYRKQNFGIMDEVESEYDQYSATMNQYKDYKSTVKKLGAELPKDMEIKIPYKYLDGEESEVSLKVPVDEKVFNKLLTDASSEAAFLNENTNGKFDEKMLQKKLLHNLKASMFDIALPKMLEEYGKEVEKRMEVVLGNKRMPGAHIANGAQNGQKPAPKANTYSALDRAMANRR